MCRHVTRADPVGKNFGKAKPAGHALGDAAQGKHVVDGVAFKATREVYLEDSRLVQQLSSLARACAPRAAAASAGGGGGGGSGDGHGGDGVSEDAIAASWLIPQAVAAFREEARCLSLALEKYAEFCGSLNELGEHRTRVRLAVPGEALPAAGTPEARFVLQLWELPTRRVENEESLKQGQADLKSANAALAHLSTLSAPGASGGATGATGVIDGIGICCFCLDRLKEFVAVLPCAHVFCADCLGEYEKAKGLKTTVVCPKCKRSHAHSTIMFGSRGDTGGAAAAAGGGDEAGGGDAAMAAWSGLLADDRECWASSVDPTCAKIDGCVRAVKHLARCAFVFSMCVSVCVCARV